MVKPKEWGVAEARHRFGEVLDAASKGAPQIIRHRNGAEFVLMSRQQYEASKPDLRTVLTSFDFGTEEDEFDRILAEFRPSNTPEATREPNVPPGHKHRKRLAQAK